LDLDYTVTWTGTISRESEPVMF